MRRAVIAAISAVLLAIAGWGYAQQSAQAPIVPFPAPGTIVNGADIGIRIEGGGPGRVIGTLMMRLNDGSWVPVQLGRSGIHKLDTN